MNHLVTYQRHGTAVILTLNRPEKRNALSRALIDAISARLGEAEQDHSVRSVILTGAGPAFCAGMDLDELRESLNLESPPYEEDARRLAALFDQLFRFPKPTIAAVNGVAVAGGCGLVTVCDLALATPEAKLGYPEVQRGLVAAMVMPHLLRHVGERTARWLLLSGELLNGIDAHRVGLINDITNEENLLTQALAWSDRLAAGGPQAVAATKQLLAQLSKPPLSNEDLALASARPRYSEECRAGLQAFFAKQPPPWRPDDLQSK